MYTTAFISVKVISKRRLYTHYGYFKYLVLPFRLINKPATFWGYINRALLGLVDVFYIVYLNNILIFFKNLEEHQRYILEVLYRL